MAGAASTPGPRGPCPLPDLVPMGRGDTHGAKVYPRVEEIPTGRRRTHEYLPREGQWTSRAGRRRQTSARRFVSGFRTLAMSERHARGRCASRDRIVDSAAGGFAGGLAVLRGVPGAAWRRVESSGVLRPRGAELGGVCAAGGQPVSQGRGRAARVHAAGRPAAAPARARREDVLVGGVLAAPLRRAARDQAGDGARAPAQPARAHAAGGGAARGARGRAAARPRGRARPGRMVVVTAARRRSGGGGAR